MGDYSVQLPLLEDDGKSLTAVIEERTTTVSHSEGHSWPGAPPLHTSSMRTKDSWANEITVFRF